ncbi:MAG TPA: sigma-54 dependent transcriptional regulator [Myxococcota bacterium]|nr:sigma-54 dependent transcriptional regulator [Myxococcota bacterium]
MARVLVVEDDHALRTAVGTALRHDGHDVELVARGDDARTLLASEPFDVVLTDVCLDGLDGIELLRAVKRDCPDTEVIVMTAFASVESAVEAMQLGAHHYLRKPFAAEDLSHAVAAAAAGASREEAAAEEAPDSRSRSAFTRIVGESRAIRDLLGLVSKVAETDSTVLVTGETGTGKELIGRAIHEASRRREKVFCALNSAAFPETLLESELFGHRRGAFTGASANKKGLFEAAHQGTVFLDEVAEMPLSMQAKLLRFLQTGEIRPLGSESTRCVDVRLVTATNKDLEAEIVAGRFREDLYYRLAVIPIRVPALRERRDDVPLLALHFLRRYAGKLGKSLERIEPAALELLQRYAWPGNVRELENTIERGVALCRSHSITVEDLPERLRQAPAASACAPAPAVAEDASAPAGLQSLDVMERRHILETLRNVGWNRKRAAGILNISTTTLWRRLKEFGIEADATLPRGALPGTSSRRF